MRIRTVAAGVAALTAVGAVAAAAPVSASSESITLTFQSLAFQDTTIAATDEIVAAWNEANPDIEVEIIQGSWDNVHDQLVTQFAGGTAPDIIHDESADIMGFANQGYLYDLSGDLSEETLSAVSDDVWSTVTIADGAVVAAPTLLQSYVVFANPAAFEAAGVELPTGDTLAWDDFQAAAEALTTDDAYGVGWGLRSPTATIMSLSLGFGGEFFTTDGDETTIEVGDAEMEVPNRIQQMAYETLSLDPVTLTQSGSEVLPGFLGGTYAMYVGGNYVAQQLTEGAPEDFEWVVLPPLAYYIAYRFCLGLQRSDRQVLEHGIETGIVRRLPHGEYVEIHQPLGPVDEHGHPVPLEYQGAPVPKRMNRLGSAGKPGAGGWWSPDPADESAALEAAHHEAELELRNTLSEYQDRVHGTSDESSSDLPDKSH